MADWTCIRCDFLERGPEAPAVCPACGTIDAFDAREAPEVASELPPPFLSLADDTAGNARTIQVIPTGHVVLDSLTNGLGAGMTSLLYGHAGTGKSTLGLAAVGGVLRGQERGLVVCPEMHRALLRHTAVRAGADLSRLDPLPLDDVRLSDWRTIVAALRPRALLVDSVTKLDDAALEWIRDWTLRTGAVTLVLAQISREGRPLGGAGIEHDPDAVLRLEKGRGKGASPVLVVEKCRYGLNAPGFAPLFTPETKPRRKRSRHAEKAADDAAARESDQRPPGDG